MYWDSRTDSRRHIRAMAEDVHRTELLRSLLASEWGGALVPFNREEKARAQELAARDKAVGRYTVEEQHWIDGLKQRVLNRSEQREQSGR